jgi:pre-mRNA-splicing factor SPF27
MSPSTEIVTALAEYEAPEDESSNEVILDSLPYFDNIHPDYEAYALTLIEEEMQTMDEIPSNQTRIGHLLNPLGPGDKADNNPAFKSSMAQNSLNINEYKQLVERQGQPRTDGVNFKEKMKSEKINNDWTQPEWNDAMNKAKAELEYERLRMVNLELQSEYESSIWKHQTKRLETISNHLKSNLSQQQMKVDQINAKRKDMQIGQAAPKIHNLNQQWMDGLNRVTLLADGVDKLGNEVEQLRAITGITFQQDESQLDDDDL